MGSSPKNARKGLERANSEEEIITVEARGWTTSADALLLLRLDTQLKRKCLKIQL